MHWLRLWQEQLGINGDCLMCRSALNSQEAYK
nr:MAG TPA: protein of unknown function DUF393 [Caudoviricetes sp.]